MREFLNTDRWIMLRKARRGRRDVAVPLRRTPKYEVMLPQIVEMAEAGSGIDLISRALGIGAEVVRDALYPRRMRSQELVVHEVDPDVSSAASSESNGPRMGKGFKC